MTKFIKHLSPTSAFLISVVFYLVLILILFPFYRYQIDPDGFSYIGIAQKYLAGDFANAINGCWGPMISWLLIPVLAVGIKPLVGFKILTSIIGLLTLFQSYKTLQKLAIDSSLFLPSLLCLAIILLNFALTLVAPDLLFAFFGMCFVNLLLSYNQNQQGFTSSILMGAIGAMLFLTKNYGLPFFIVTFSLISFVIFIRTSDKVHRLKLLSNYLIGIIVFGIISFIWIYLISNKYGYWTFGTAGHYNHRVFGPQSLGHPMFYIGLMEPPNGTATTIMEDFSNVELPAWAAQDMASNLKFYVSRLLNNLFGYFKIINDFSFATASILLVSVVFLIQKGKKSLHNHLLVILLFLFVLTIGYVMLVIEHRYLWLYNLLMVVVGSYLLTQLFEKVNLIKSANILLVLMFYCSFLLYPGITLSRNINKGLNFYKQSEQLKKLGVEGKIATKGTWYGGAVMAYYTNSQFYGTCANTVPELVIKELATYDINYLIVWRNAYSELDDAYFDNITNGMVEDFEVYRIRSR